MNAPLHDPAAEPDDAAPVFRTRTGRYIGMRTEGVVKALGIRYATAGRFRPPVPVAASDDLVDATTPAPACPQRVPRTNEIMGDPERSVVFDEDCLRLSVTLPNDTFEGERLPVLVWVHGGSYVFGAGDLPLLDPATLVREQRVVVVAVTYRLGILGFLGGAHPGGGGRPANLGLLDIREALRWVNASIGAFGGDPDRVTLVGQSAGGDAVAHLMISDGVDGLFQRVVIQSAPFGLRRRRARMSRSMLEAAGPLDASTPLAEVHEAEARADAVGARFGFKAGMPFGTQYGHAPLPTERAAAGRWREVASRYDSLIGWTSQETSLFVDFSPQLVRLFSAPRIGAALRDLALKVSTDIVYRVPGRRFARMLARAGGSVATYELDWRPRGGPLGATHTIDLALLFPGPLWRGAGVLGEVRPDELPPLGEAVRAVWANFAATGRIDEASIERIPVPMRFRLPGRRHGLWRRSGGH